MQKRLFIAVNVPENIREKIDNVVHEVQYKFGEKTRFVSKDNWHFTLAFLGDQDETKIPAIEKAVSKIAGAAKEIFGESGIIFNKLTYGPFEGLAKRMIWLTADQNSSLNMNKIRRVLTEELLANGLRWQIDNRPFQCAHITLARFRPRNIKDLPPITKEINWQCDLNDIDLMESRLKQEGPIYEKISTFAINRKIPNNT